MTHQKEIEREAKMKIYTFQEAVEKLLEYKAIADNFAFKKAGKQPVDLTNTTNKVATRLNSPPSANDLYRFEIGRTETNPLKNPTTGKDFIIAPDDLTAGWIIEDKG